MALSDGRALERQAPSRRTAICTSVPPAGTGLDDRQLVVETRREPLKFGKKATWPAPCVNDEPGLGELRKRAEQLVSLPHTQRGDYFIDMEIAVASTKSHDC